MEAALRSKRPRRARTTTHAVARPTPEAGADDVREPAQAGSPCCRFNVCIGTAGNMTTVQRRVRQQVCAFRGKRQPLPAVQAQALLSHGRQAGAVCDPRWALCSRKNVETRTMVLVEEWFGNSHNNQRRAANSQTV